VIDALAKAGKVLEHLVEDVLVAVLPLSAEHSQPQILQHREVGEHAPLLGNPRDPAPGDLVGAERGHVVAAQAHAALPGPRDPHDRAERRGLAGAVAADEGDHLALADRQRHALQNVRLAVVGVDLLDGEQAHRPAPR
jgi:hypothetical protein